MKKYLYYATEENCFETEKHETTDIRADIKSFLADDFCQLDTQEETATSIENEVKTDGYGYSVLENGQGYTIIIGVAMEGKCKHISKLITEFRRQAIGY